MATDEHVNCEHDPEGVDTSTFPSFNSPELAPNYSRPNRATRRGNKLHPRSAKNRADYRPGTVRPY